MERAVGSQADDFEPDGSEDTDEETPKRFVFQHRSHPDTELQNTIGSTMLGDAPSIAEDLEPPEVQVYVSSKDERTEPPEAVHVPLEDEDEELSSADLNMDGLIDEAALREIVSQMVRAELQGELGEKITRNVRKLVRREIHRVLLTHDFG